MRIQLSDHFTYGRLLRFALPSVTTLLFCSIYGVVDGIFVSNLVGKTEFAAVNLIMPIMMIIGGVGFMMGAGGTAVVAKTLGEKEDGLARRYFSLFVYATAALGIALATLGAIFVRPLSELLGAEGAMLDACESYGRIVLLAMPCFMLQNLFQSFFIVAEKPKLGLWVTVAAGIANILLDALFVGALGFGLEGAALATSLSQMIGAATPIFYFARKNSSLLRLTKTRFYGRIFLKAATNGSSELMSNISSSVVTMLYNMQLMVLTENGNGVAAYGVIMYVSFIFISIFIGFSVGTAPIVGYNFGAKNAPEMKNILRKSTVILFSTGFLMSAAAFIFARPLATIFVGYDENLLEMTVEGLKIFSLSFVLSGFSIFGSSFFTALNNGPVSAFISFMRTLVFQALGIIILPIFFGLGGVWYSMLIAELCAIVTTVIFLFINKKKYGY